MNRQIPLRKRKKPALLQAFHLREAVMPQIDALSHQFPDRATNLNLQFERQIALFKEV